MTINGKYRIQITGANVTETLQKISLSGCELSDVQPIDELNVSFCVKRCEYPAVSKIIHKYGDQEKILIKDGLFWSAAALMRRPVLLVGLFVLMVLVLYLPTRILFVEVEGNTSVPSQYIIEQAANCGIRFGSARREVRSEKVKNALLSSIPQLRWAGVNTAGCVAVISVQERKPVDKGAESSGIGSIVAGRDGILCDVTVIRGNALCKVGQAVKAGQVLISGYTDCGFCIKTEKADGEIIALTSRSIEAITPVISDFRGDRQGIERKYSLRIGKNIINFFKDSGISDTTCVKMYDETEIALPGGFHLPVGIIRQTWIYGNSTARDPDSQNSDDYDWLATSAERYLSGQMIAGEILSKHDRIDLRNNVCTLYGTYYCRENIGQVKNEEFYGNGRETN